MTLADVACLLVAVAAIGVCGWSQYRWSRSIEWFNQAQMVAVRFNDEVEHRAKIRAEAMIKVIKATPVEQVVTPPEEDIPQAPPPHREIFVARTLDDGHEADREARQEQRRAARGGEATRDAWPAQPNVEG